MKPTPTTLQLKKCRVNLFSFFQKKNVE